METSNIIQLVILAVLGIIAICIFFSNVFTLHTKEAAIIERFGKFHRVATEGLNVKIPFIDSKVYTEDLAMQLMDIPVASKTKDDSTVTLPVRVQYYVLPDKVRQAYYELDDPESQISAHVQNVILSFVPSLTLDQVYEQEGQIAAKIKNSLDAVMSVFGYAIENALVTSVTPAPQVVQAMNEINAARREKIAAEARADALYVMTTRNAEAEAEARFQAGTGVARERKAIIDGLKESIEGMQEALGKETSMDDVMTLILMNNYFDMMKVIGQNSNTILFPHSPDGMPALMAQFRAAFTERDKAA